MPDSLELEVKDYGVGFSDATARHGIGLVAMRERADLLRGNVEFLQPAEGGTLVRFTVSFDKVESDEPQNIRPAR
jgi:signal transduction histidine kinase